MIIVPPAPASYRITSTTPIPTPQPPSSTKRAEPSSIKSSHHGPSKRSRTIQAAPAPVHRSAPSIPVGDVPKELGELIERDVQLLSTMGWHDFALHRRGRGDFASLLDLDHPARRLLLELKQQGAPVDINTPPWSPQHLRAALKRGPHKSCSNYIEFLEEEFIDMVHKGQWVVLPYKTAKRYLPDMRVSPPGVVPQRDRRARWIGDYSFSGINEDTLDTAPSDAMQFGHAFDRLIREIILANPEFGPVHLAKGDMSDGFYRVGLKPGDAPKLCLAFPHRPGASDYLVAVPLVLPMGWTNSPPFFSAVTETIADVTNDNLADMSYDPLPHRLDAMAAEFDKIESWESAMPRLLPRESHDAIAVAPQPVRDPCLPFPETPLQYTDIYVDDFIPAAQQPFLQRTRLALLHAIDQVIRPLDSSDNPSRREPVSLKKLRQGDCSWATIKSVLGWVIDTVNMTIHLPPHRIDRLWEILDSIPRHQKRTSVKKWHKVLGELRSMAVALPGSRNMFSRLQRSLASRHKGRIALNKGTHQALEDFRWMANDISSRPTRIAELVPLDPILEGHHDAAGSTGAGGVWFPGENANVREGYLPNVPVLWRLPWPQDIIDRVVTDANPSGTITNSDLELAGGLLHLDCAAQVFDTRERTILSKGDNLNTTHWERKGSTSTESAAAFLLRLFGIHQRFHRYVPRFDYISGPSNHLADALSRYFDLPLSDIYSQYEYLFPQSHGFQVWTPPSGIVSSIISALRKKQSPREFLLVAPPPPSRTGTSGSVSAMKWASTPLSKPSRTKYQSYKSSSTEFVSENLQPKAIKSGLDRLKITYGQLLRRSSPWGPTTHA